MARTNGLTAVVFSAVLLTGQAGGCSPPGSEPVDRDGRWEKLALLVGIDEYKYVGNLRGAVNDVDNMFTLLKENFAFPEGHIKVLKNGEATRKGILTAMKEDVIDRAKGDTIVVFHYAGHGSRLREPPDDSEEPDGYDETLVPHDSGRAPRPNLDITDDEIRSFLEAISEITPNVTFVFDSCHSGSGARGAGLVRSVVDDDRPTPKRDDLPFALARGVGGEDELAAAGSKWTLIAGCRADQVSRELTINGESYGAMSWFFADSIRKAGPKATYVDIMDTVETEVSSRYDQNPQLEGPGMDRMVFGTESDVRPPYVLVQSVGSGELTLAAGQVQGVTEGSIYDVYAPATSDFSAPAAGRVEVKGVDITTAKAKILEGSPAQAGRAVEREHFYPDPVLRVHLMGVDESPTLQAIKSDLESLKMVEIDTTGAGYDILLREHGDLGSTQRFIVTEGGDPTDIAPRVAVDDPQVVPKVSKHVQQWAKWFNILGIENAQPAFGLAFRIKAAEGAGREARSLAGRELSLAVTAGTKVTIEAENTSTRNLYLAVLDLSSDGSVSLVYPEAGQQEYVEPGKTWSREVETFVPNGFDSVVDILKVFATTSPAEFSFLRQGAVRGERSLAQTRGPRNPLEELLGSAALGTTRGMRPVKTGDWTTAEQVLGVGRQ